MVALDFRSLVEAAPDLIGVVDREQRFLFVNAALARAMGSPAAALIGERAERRLSAEAARDWREALEDVLGEGGARAVEHMLETPAGPRRFAALISALPEGRAWAVWRDITDARRAEEARDRAHRLQALTAALSGAAEQRQVVRAMVEAVRDALGAMAGLVWLLRGDELELVLPEGRGRSALAERFSRFSLSARLPVCDVIRTQQPLMFESLVAMATVYPVTAAASESPSRAWAVVPFVARGRSLGAVSFSFADERGFGAEDRELLVAMAGQASLALDRCALAAAAPPDAER